MSSCDFNWCLLMFPVIVRFSSRVPWRRVKPITTCPTQASAALTNRPDTTSLTATPRI